jgi:hypothetical protein
MIDREWAPIAVTLLPRTWEVVGSNLGCNTDYRDVLRGLPQSLQINAGIVLRLRHNCFVPNPFILSNSLPFGALWSCY